jgi:hypothetical protein
MGEDKEDLNSYLKVRFLVEIPDSFQSLEDKEKLINELEENYDYLENLAENGKKKDVEIFEKYGEALNDLICELQVEILEGVL